LLGVGGQVLAVGHEGGTRFLAVAVRWGGGGWADGLMTGNGLVAGGGMTAVDGMFGTATGMEWM